MNQTNSSSWTHPSHKGSDDLSLLSRPRMGLFNDEAGLAPSSSVTRAKGSTVPSSKKVAAASTTSTTQPKKPVRDSKRRATHSQIERRRREKINDRLVTLRSLVPACAAEIEERKRQKREEEEEARKIAAGEKVASGVRGKRKRNRKKASKTEDGGEKEDELGLHKLEVLTHTIDYIYELQDRIHQLQGDHPIVRNRLHHTHGTQETDDEDGSDANLEMSEWKPRVSERDSRPSSTSSESSSLAPTSEVPSLTGEPHRLSTATSSSSTSIFTSLTSPMMSLSSGSPILRWGNQPSSSPVSIRERDVKSLSSKNLMNIYGSEWNLPAAMLPVDGVKTNSLKRCRLSDPADSPKGSQSEASTSAQDAHLLLHLGTSPEALRPISAVRQTYNRASLHRRKSTTTTGASHPFPALPLRLSRIGESAPGGAHASSSVALTSPPLLALDDPSCSASR